MNQAGLMKKVLGDNWYNLSDAIRSHYPTEATQTKPSILIGLSISIEIGQLKKWVYKWYSEFLITLIGKIYF